MGGGTPNLLRIFGSTSGDYGVQADGETHDWTERASCVGLGPEFHPDHTIHPGSAEAKNLADICARCPVLEQCRNRAQETDAEFGFHGFWAGLTADERKGQSKHKAELAARDAEITWLAGVGHTDADIAALVGMSKSGVMRSRRRTGTAPARTPGDSRGGARGRSQIERERA